MLLVPAQILMIYFSQGLSLEFFKIIFTFKYVICLDALGSRTDLDDIFLTGPQLGVDLLQEEFLIIVAVP
jgi:hypothetical protein